MLDLAYQFEKLIGASQEGYFKEALTDSALANQPAQRHPLNFVAIRVEDGSGLGLRLHLWDSRFKFGQRGFEIHDHVFDLDSYVMDGAVRQTLYEITPTKRGTLRAYEVEYKGSAAQLQPLRDKIGLRELRVDRLTTGTRYTLRRGILHRLEALTPTAITLVLTNTHQGRPMTIGPSNEAPVPLTERPYITGPEGELITLESHGLDAISVAARD